MDTVFSTIFANASIVYLCGLMAAALFFLVVGLRQINEAQLEGMLFIALSVFFFAAHFFYLTNLPDTTPLGSADNLAMVWYWLSDIFAPALIGLYLLIGAYNFVVTQVKLGLTKIFFGLSLSAFLYWLGLGWAIDVRGILTLIWTVVWFNVELETVN